VVVDYDLDSETRMQVYEERQQRRDMRRRRLELITNVFLVVLAILLAIAALKMS